VRFERFPLNGGNFSFFTKIIIADKYVVPCRQPKKTRPAVPLQRPWTMAYGRIAKKIKPKNHDTKFQSPKSPDH
jgi:hypothetical protein